MNSEQTKCDSCGRRFGEMEDDPVECSNCDLVTCPDCPCDCNEDEESS